MAFEAIYQISSSAMTAQTVRLNTIASNLANAETPAAAEDSTYKARRPVFASVYHTAQNPHHSALQSARVQVLDVVETSGALQRYQPGTHWQITAAMSGTPKLMWWKKWPT